MGACEQHNTCMESALVQAEALCHSRGSRLTEIRRTVLSLIWASHRPTKAYDVLAELQKQGAGAKPPTVYRALDFLLEQGLIHKLHRLNAYVGCPHPAEDAPCFFMICQKCDTVTDSHDMRFQQMIAHLSNAHHFTPSAMSFEVEGLCQQCT